MKSAFIFFSIFLGLSAKADSVPLRCNFLADNAMNSQGQVEGSWDGPMLFNGTFLQVSNEPSRGVRVEIFAPDGAFDTEMAPTSCAELPAILGLSNSDCFAETDKRFSEVLVVPSGLLSRQIPSGKIFVLGNFANSSAIPAGSFLKDEYFCK